MQQGYCQQCFLFGNAAEAPGGDGGVAGIHEALADEARQLQAQEASVKEAEELVRHKKKMKSDKN